MPFTFSHPAMVLPLAYLPKRYVSLTGLIVGSLSPDFEYFLRMKVLSSFSHTLPGLLWFDLPLAILLACIFHLVVRDKLIESLPNFLQSRLILYKDFKWIDYIKMNMLTVIISCTVGALTHIFWDGFTHQDGYIVQNLSGLQERFFVFGYGIPIYKALQHTSSLVGALIISYAIFTLPVRPSVNRSIDWKYWVVIVVTTLIVLTIRATIASELSLDTIVVSMIAGGLLGMILSPTITSWK